MTAKRSPRYSRNSRDSLYRSVPGISQTVDFGSCSLESWTVNIQLRNPSTSRTGRPFQESPTCWEKSRLTPVDRQMGLTSFTALGWLPLDATVRGGPGAASRQDLPRPHAVGLANSGFVEK